MIRVHKIQLYPNNKQATYFIKACGVARFAYNWGLSEWKRRYEAGDIVKESKLWRSLNAIKREQYPWIREIAKCVPQLAIKSDLGGVLKDFLARKEQFPKYRKKGSNESFSLTGVHFEAREKKVWIPLLGWVNMAEELRFDGNSRGAVISKTGDKWHISIQVEIPDTETAHERESQAVGISIGDNTYAAISDGTMIGAKETNIQNERKLLRLKRELSRRQGAKEGEQKSENYKKTERKISRLHAKSANIQANKTHQQTTKLVREYGLICIEDTNDSQTNDQSFVRYSQDTCYYTFNRQLKYKAAASGSRIIVPNKWFPSSKWCSTCGGMNEGLEMPDHEWVCEICGAHHNRDINTAINLRDYAIRANNEQETP